MAVHEADLRILVREFDIAAHPSCSDPNAPATIADLNRAVTQMSVTLDKLITALYTE